MTDWVLTPMDELDAVRFMTGCKTFTKWCGGPSGSNDMDDYYDPMVHGPFSS